MGRLQETLERQIRQFQLPEDLRRRRPIGYLGTQASPGQIAEEEEEMFIPFNHDAQLTPAATGQFTNWGFGVQDAHEGAEFIAARAVSRVTVYAKPEANSYTLATGRFRVFREGIVVPALDITWGPGDATVKNLVDVAVAIAAGESLSFFVGPVANIGVGTFDFLRGGVLLRP